ncbi:hypothetical protein CPB86DRAFT_779960 [Serendipita vermifera]|nr:hypothetical protein CPB86DRAFT_779960 [Serendipita vermifera]
MSHVPYDEVLVSKIMQRIQLNRAQAIQVLASIPALRNQFAGGVPPQQQANNKNLQVLLEVIRIVDEHDREKALARNTAYQVAQPAGFTQQDLERAKIAIIQQNQIHDPTNITLTVSSNAAAHADPGPVAWPSVRPTLTGGVPTGLQNGTPSLIQAPMDDPSMFLPDIRPTSLRKTPAEQHVRKKMQELVSTVDPNVKVDADAEELLLEIADEFIDSVANFACRLAKHRGSDHLDVKDLQLHLEMHHGIRIPGFSVDQTTQSSAAQASSAGGAGATMVTNVAGNKKAATTAGAVANMKRSSRLAAVNQAKKDARLL